MSLVVVSGLVEGDVDEAVLQRLVESAGATLGTVYGKQGKANLLQNLPKYNQAAQHLPWIVLVDLDGDAPCAPAFREKHLPNPAPLLCFRIAVRAVESWLLADRQNLSRFLGIAQAKLPRKPEDEENPKRTLVNLARKSNKKEIRQDMVPAKNSRAQVGNAYSSRLIDFITDHWSLQAAAANADSLQRCQRALQHLTSELS